MLAIIIPYYKPTFFEATLQSLSAQTCQDFKVYIGDDASPEAPSMLLESYQEKLDFVYRRFETNLGGTSLTKQWERCIALSKEEPWIMILGDDDELEDNVVEAFYKNLPEIERNGSNVVRFATQIINEEGNAISRIFEHPKLEKASDSFWRKFKGETRSSLSEYVFSRGSYLKFGFRDYPLAWHSDDKAWLEFSSGKLIYTINEINVFIRTSIISISGKKDNKDFKHIAGIQFLRDLCLLKFFNREQNLELMYSYEVEIKKNRKLSLTEWMFLFKIYLKNMGFIAFGKFIRRLITSFFS